MRPSILNLILTRFICESILSSFLKVSWHSGVPFCDKDEAFLDNTVFAVAEPSVCELCLTRLVADMRHEAGPNQIISCRMMYSVLAGLHSIFNALKGSSIQLMSRKRPDLLHLDAKEIQSSRCNLPTATLSLLASALQLASRRQILPFQSTAKRSILAGRVLHLRPRLSHRSREDCRGPVAT